MAEPETKSKAVREWVVGLLLPLTIFAYTLQKDRSDEEAHQLDRVATIIKSLGSTSTMEQSYALDYIKYLSREQKAPGVVAQLLRTYALNAPTGSQSAAAVNTLVAIQPNQNSNTVARAVPTRVYIHIRTEADRPTAEEIQKALRDGGINVPGIERVGVGPSSTDLRYFHPEDKTTADGIASRLAQLGISTKTEDFAQAVKTPTPPGQFELWLAPGAKVKDGI